MTTTINKNAVAITPKQIALLHVVKNELYLDDDTYRQIIRAYGAVESAKYMKLDGFERVMRHFEDLGFTSAAAHTAAAAPQVKQPRRRPSRDAGGSPYPAQLNMINHHFLQLGMDTAERREGFCRRVIKKPWPQTRAEANKVFEGLKAMLKRELAKADQTK